MPGKARTFPEAPKEPLVSVIIPTRNSERTLQACLESLANQEYRNIEIIVVDNCSVDKTKAIANAHSAQFLSHGPERTAQKNYGFEHSSGNFVFFVDSDMVVSRGVVSDCVSESRHFDALTIPEHSFGAGFWVECRILERSCYQDDMWAVAARFFHRKIFESLNGFDETLEASGDDTDLHNRAKRQGYRIGAVKSMIHHDEGFVTPLSTFKKWRYYGQNMWQYARRDKKQTLIRYAPLRPAWVKNWRKLLGDPIHTAGFLTLKSCQVLGVLIGHLDQHQGSMVKSPYPDNPSTASVERDRVSLSRAKTA